MTTTHASLLLRLKDRSDTDAWNEFHKLYPPLLYRYARRRGLSRDDAEEIRDQCMEVVTRKMPTFEYDKEKGGFKNWLRQVADNKVMDFSRKRRERKADTEEIRAPPDDGPSPAEIWEQSWRNEHLKHCVEKARGRVSERNFRVFQMLMQDNCTVEEVCKSLGLNPNQVYKAKAQVLEHVERFMADFDSSHPNQPAGKICVICHEDCSSRSRVKDRAGNYYCQACHERSKKELAARKRAAARKQGVAAAGPSPSPESPPVDDGFDALAAAAAAAAAAPPVEVPRPAAPVAAPPQAPPPPAPRAASPRRVPGMPDALKQPWIASVLPVLILGVLFIRAQANDDRAALFLIPQALFILAVWLIVLVQAFRKSIGTGILTLCVPFYSFYFVFYVNQNPYIKRLFVALLLGKAASFWVGSSLGDSMPLSPGN